MNFLRSIVSRKLFWLAFIYLALLIWSGVYRVQHPQTETPNNKKTVKLSAISGDKILDRKVRVTYQEIGKESGFGNVPIILVHGSPGSSEAFNALAKLIKNRRIISVDLPGFGDSEMSIPDYSIYAHSKYLSALMEELEIEKAHFVGFSLGGGVILHLADGQPEQVGSLSFIASIGVQEYELLGNFYANRTVHIAQLGFFWFLKNLTPHFGVFDGMMISYARNFYDTDQRPLREILQNVEKPFLILHGKDDPLVPVEAAREHARLVPQSEYHELDDNHFFVFMRPEKIEKTLTDFWTRVENGVAKNRGNANASRITISKEPFSPKVLRAKGATIFVFFLIILLLVLVNEDLAFLLAGFLAAQGRFGLSFAIFASIAGLLISVILLLLVGRFFRNKSASQTDSSIGLIVSLKRRFFGFHSIRYFRIGKTGQNFWKSVLYLSISAIVWAVALNCASYLISGFFY